ncbi:MAG TPA: hemerythrin domain-containing protein [Candidatus Limnocylindrales bacterium]|nr:hemerythrin domain-containing protein [Candidatus Limnocylindrales bacterium]
MPTKTDAISLLKADHEKVRGLLSQLEKSTDRAASRRETLLAQLETEILIHTTIEEEIFYPAYREAVSKKEDRKLYQEAIEEHHVVDLVLPEVKEADPASEIFSAKAKVLKELIEHHAEEEEKEMFKRARKAFETEELKELGERMMARKEELMEQMQAEGGGAKARKSRSSGRGKRSSEAMANGHDRAAPPRQGGRSESRHQTAH